jgi:hypothetical protein
MFSIMHHLLGPVGGIRKFGSHSQKTGSRAVPDSPKINIYFAFMIERICQ